MAKKSNNKSRSSGDAINSISVSPLNSSIINEEIENYCDAGEETSNSNRKSAAQKKKSSTKHGNNKNNNSSNYRVMSDAKLSEEAALTARLFGGGGAPTDGTAAWMDDDDDEESAPAASKTQPYDDTLTNNDNNSFVIDRSGEASGDLFAIDRSGEEVTDDVEEEEEEEVEENGAEQQDSEDDNREFDNSDGDDGSDAVLEDYAENNKASMSGAAWEDSNSEHSDSDDSDDDSLNDDDSSSSSNLRLSKKQKKVSLVDGPSRLKKLRRYRDETDPLSIKEYELRLRERFMNTSSVAARTDWANVGLAQKQQQQDEEAGSHKQKQKKKRGYGSSSDDGSSDEEEEYEDSANKILQSNASLFESSASGLPLPPTLLNVIRSRDGNLSDPNNSVVNATQFHPGSDEDAPLLMTAGMDKMLRFFRINEEGEGENTKIHGIHFPTLPITCASFLGNSGSVVLSGRRPFFYVYDAVSGNIQKVPSIVGRKERSLEKFTVSPTGQYIAFIGNDGYIILVDGKTYQWVGDLKMNGSVRAITFTEDGEYILGSGSDGDVYRWHIGSRRCVERFHNQDGTITSSLALSSNFLAVAAESGVVNLYDDRQSLSSTRRGHGGGLSLAATERTPLKSIMNLTTSADNICFNHDGQILAMSSRRETNGLKLLHVPTATVFSNWPTSKTPLKYVWSMDFSPGSKYMAIGNDRGKCLLYRLNHYWDE